MAGTPHFGTFLRNKRLAAGYRSQRALSRVTGLSQATINRLESGERGPSTATLDVLAAALGVPKHVLVCALYRLENCA
jgi:transcriptional regulator with XRE-family HTH domain